MSQQVQLTREEKRIIIDRGTELPFTGKYVHFKGAGTYVCKQCGALLYRSSDKFDAGCGWPAFDDAVEGAVRQLPDPDGVRTEIVCARCGAHLGHLFSGEGFTRKNIRHCVNSLSLDFQSAPGEQWDTAFYAGGCFWGVEYYMQRVAGVLTVESGYMGGHIDDPTYQQVKAHTTGHAEVVRVVFDPTQTDYETLTKLFFEIHDPTQLDGQGPDLGEQYRSEIFYTTQKQKSTAEKLIAILRDKGYPVVTRLTEASTFWPAEDYHQNHYNREGSTPYCHGYTKRF